jgi:hypothetical protein
MKTKIEAKCCHCGGCGRVPGNRVSDQNCPHCSGGWGGNVFRIMEYRTQPDGRYAWEEIVCWPGRIHASTEEYAKDFARSLHITWFVEKM